MIGHLGDNNKIIPLKALSINIISITNPHNLSRSSQVLSINHKTMQKTILQKIQEAIRKIAIALGIIQKQVEAKVEEAEQMTNRDKLYQTAKRCIGQDMSEKLDEYGCAEALNAVFKKAFGRDIGGDTSTYRMHNALNNPVEKRFEKVTEPLPGDIIISPTGYGNGKVPNGHCGIISDNNKIMSNNSNTSLWDEHLNIFQWRYRYEKNGGYQVDFYRVI